MPLMFFNTFDDVPDDLKAHVERVRSAKAEAVKNRNASYFSPLGAADTPKRCAYGAEHDLTALNRPPKGIAVRQTFLPTQTPAEAGADWVCQQCRP